MGLRATAVDNETWLVTGIQEYKIPMSITQEMKRRERPDADYFEPRVSIEFPYGDNNGYLESPENIRVGWNAFYNRTVEELREGVEKAIEEVEKDNIEELEAYIRMMKRDSRRVSVTNLVVLGIGSLHAASYHLTDNVEEERRLDQYQLNVAHSQLAIVIKLAEIFREGERPIPCVIQDPAYSTMEKECLRSLGFLCVDDPDAFACVNEGSLLFSVGTYWHMLKRVSAGPWPAVLVCNGRMCNSPANNIPLHFNPDSVKDMIRGCDEDDFPYRRHANSWTNGVKLYWRRVIEKS